MDRLFSQGSAGRPGPGQRTGSERGRGRELGALARKGVARAGSGLALPTGAARPPSLSRLRKRTDSIQASRRSRSPRGASGSGYIYIYIYIYIYVLYTHVCVYIYIYIHIFSFSWFLPSPTGGSEKGDPNNRCSSQFQVTQNVKVMFMLFHGRVPRFRIPLRGQ